MDKYENLNPADDIFDHDHLDPETLQERADVAREARIYDLGMSDTEKALRHHNAIMDVINKGIK